MSDVRLVCLDGDDLLHPNTGEGNFNESAYFNFYDAALGLGGFSRLGNRPNEGIAEMTLCLYLPDGRVAFMFKRPKIDGNDAFDAGGMRFEIRSPMREHGIRYDGSCIVMTRPLDLLDPRAAFTTNPVAKASVDLTYRAISKVHGGEPRVLRGGEWVGANLEQTGQEFAKGHLEQHGRATGTVTVDGTTWTVDGFGLRDRSWGPRFWQAPDHYRWLTMNFGSEAGIAAALTVQRDGRRVMGGYLWEPGVESRRVARVDVESEHEPEHGLHTALRATLTMSDGGTETVDGRVLRMVPLRNRREDVTTRIAEGLTEWHWRDRVGHGWSEFLDHV
jgi:hypothetical protein